MNGRLRFALLSLAAPLLVFATTTTSAVELDPAVVTVRTPDQLKWRDPANKGPNNGVSLLGDGKTGHYVNITNGTEATTSVARIFIPTTA